jgi:hypothetical protein
MGPGKPGEMMEDDDEKRTDLAHRVGSFYENLCNPSPKKRWQKKVYVGAYAPTYTVFCPTFLQKYE